MHERRCGIGPSERLVKEHVEGSRWEPLFATDYVGHLHEMVIYDIGKMICRQIVGALIEHLVVKYR